MLEAAFIFKYERYNLKLEHLHLARNDFVYLDSTYSESYEGSWHGVASNFNERTSSTGLCRDLISKEVMLIKSRGKLQKPIIPKRADPFLVQCRELGGYKDHILPSLYEEVPSF